MAGSKRKDTVVLFIIIPDILKLSSYQVQRVQPSSRTASGYFLDMEFLQRSLAIVDHNSPLKNIKHSQRGANSSIQQLVLLTHKQKREHIVLRLVMDYDTFFKVIFAKKIFCGVGILNTVQCEPWY